MDMVGHQAVGPNIDTITDEVFLSQIKIAEIVDLGREDGPVEVPALDDVMGVADDSGAGEPGQSILLGNRRHVTNSREFVPRCPDF
jgi:hypothetical protein